MKTVRAHSVSIAFLIIFLNSAVDSKAISQTNDSLSTYQSSSAALQFQLIGGLGVYYLAECSSFGNLRIGADASFNHTGSSGSSQSNTTYLGGTPVYSSQSGSPDQSTTSYQVSLSGLYLHRLVAYEHATLYFGAGLVASISHNKYTNNLTSTSSTSYGAQSSSINEYVSKTTTWGAGALGIVGIRTQVYQQISLCAEIGFSALHNWTSEITTSTTRQNEPPPFDFTNSTTTSDLKGWSLSLSNIRIGLIIAV